VKKTKKVTARKPRSLRLGGGYIAAYIDEDGRPRLFTSYFRGRKEIEKLHRWMGEYLAWAEGKDL
jgi:hypothetical protein